ncbi:HNH endonuclease [Sphingobacterium multivorum]|uniref:HNH endonuclease n=2 Tax=Sphingobacterium multivorum TaxID=28454 RepID=A0A653XHV0_SPHMU|nr:HNH endonuclease [Sphingobacterium multivorum]VXC29628.1 HNH endonuclease [Sphingobacterium multivorum]
MGLSKKIRFEVFKRDRFTCQYCGAKAPETVLNVDHIEPVAKGGSDEILNLITSCFDCNNGKRDKRLVDSSVLEKQRQQLELLQERREQIEFMLEWKKSLSEFDNDIHKMILDYINGKMSPWLISDSEKGTIGQWLKKYEVEQILEGIDIAATKYLKQDEEGTTNESADLFVSKIGGVLHVKSLSPIQQKIAYIKGIARNRFNYWDEKKGAIILTNYVNALQQHYDEEQMLADLEKEVERITKSSKNWTEWRDLLENWTQDVYAWEKPSEEKEITDPVTQKEYTIEQLSDFATYSTSLIEVRIILVEHLASILPDFDKHLFRKVLLREMLNFLTAQYESDMIHLKDHEKIGAYLEEYARDSDLGKFFNISNEHDEIKGFYLFKMKFIEELGEIFHLLYLSPTYFKTEHINEMAGIQGRMLIDLLDEA